MTFLEAYDLHGPDTIAIAEAMGGVDESVAANALARLKGETEPHPKAETQLVNEASYRLQGGALICSITRRPA